MKMVKMFDAWEIEKAINVDLCSYLEAYNDTAKRWHVTSPLKYNDYDYSEEHIKINDYLLNNGADIDDTVWIKFEW